MLPSQGRRAAWDLLRRGKSILVAGAARSPFHPQSSSSSFVVCAPSSLDGAQPLPTAPASSGRWPRASQIHSTATPCHGGGNGGSGDEEAISVTFVEKDGERTVKVPIGESLLEAAHKNDIELEGACEGSLACSTCHVIVENQEYYDLMDEPDDDELDMLDLAFGLTETSRLGCQILGRKDLDGLKVKIPSATRNFAVDGFKPKPH